MHSAQRIVNHVALVLDASWSMAGRETSLTKAADEQIKHLALRSEELNQETRVSVYYFGDSTIECLLFDMDVMRLPSIADLYKVLYQNTALIDATFKAQEDLSTTSQIYGDHAFLTFVLTDGQENSSRRSVSDLRKYIMGMDENWSIGFLVPDQTSVVYMERLGVLRDSIAIWDTNSTAGLKQATSAIRTATDNFMTARASGVRGTRSVFSTSAAVVNKTSVKSLTALKPGTYEICPVTAPSAIREFVEKAGYRYSAGMAYYQLTKTETIQSRKQVAVFDKKTGKVYSGQQARHLVGLPDDRDVRVKPDANPDYEVYIQSTSVNRKLLAGTKLLVITP